MVDWYDKVALHFGYYQQELRYFEVTQIKDLDCSILCIKGTRRALLSQFLISSPDRDLQSSFKKIYSKALNGFLSLSLDHKRQKQSVRETAPHLCYIVYENTQLETPQEKNPMLSPCSEDSCCLIYPMVIASKSVRKWFLSQKNYLLYIPPKKQLFLLVDELYIYSGLVALRMVHRVKYNVKWYVVPG